jgi:hypothetical protein
VITLPKLNNAFRADATITPSGKLQMNAVVNDQGIRDMGVKHDGYETVDAFIPTSAGGNWQPVRLNYETEVAIGGNSPRDIYDASLQLSPEQANAVRANGVAFRIQTNSGETIWAQQPGDNTFVHDQR